MKKYCYYIKRNNVFSIYKPNDEWLMDVDTEDESRNWTAFFNDIIIEEDRIV